MLLACLLAALAAPVQDPPSEPTIAERLDALIAKTNAYEAFVANYRVKTKDGEEITIRIAYSAPQRLVLDFQCGDARGVTRIQPDRWDDLRFQSGSETCRASVSNWNLAPAHLRRMRALFDVEYPGLIRAEDLPTSETPFIELQVARESVTFNFGFGLAQCTRLDWLARMRRVPERVSLVGDGNRDFALSLRDDLTMIVSSEHGLVTRLQRQTQSGDSHGLELASFQTDPQLVEAEFVLPDPGPQVRDTSDELELMTARMGFSNSRKSLFSALAQVIDDGRFKWTGETFAKVERIVRAVHAVDYQPVCAGLLARSRAAIAQVSASIAESLRDPATADPVALAQLHKDVAATRQKLEESLGTLLAEPQPEDLPGRKCKLRPTLYEELALMEKPILSALFAELVTKPALAEFDEKVAKQLDAK
jgi:hypothetical protein